MLGRSLILLSLFLSIATVGFTGWKDLSLNIFHISFMGKGDDSLLLFAYPFIWGLKEGEVLKICRVRGPSDMIVYDIDEYDKEVFWVSSLGLFRFNGVVERLFLPKTKDIFALSVGPLGIFFGTSNGLYKFSDESALPILSTNSNVLDILALPDRQGLLILTSTRFIFYDLSQEKQVFSYVFSSNRYVDQSGQLIARDKDRVLFAIDDRVYEWFIASQEVRPVYRYPGHINGICFVDGDLLVYGSSGVFGLDGQERDSGLRSRDVKKIVALDMAAYLLSDKLYVWQSFQSQGSISKARIFDILNREPDILTLQEKAMEFAGVSPDKIIDWRRRLKKRALLPEFSIDMDLDNNRTLSDSVAVSSSGSSNVGPDDKTMYKAVGLGISLDWDLKELIWSSEEVSIDTRAKLNTELRDDILSQLNQLYFEWKRQQVKLLDKNLKPEKALSLLFKIQKLRADIDALTGGFLSRALRQRGILDWERDFVMNHFFVDEEGGEKEEK